VTVRFIFNMKALMQHYHLQRWADGAWPRRERRTGTLSPRHSLLGDYLAEGLAQFGYTCEEFAREHLG